MFEKKSNWLIAFITTVLLIFLVYFFINAYLSKPKESIEKPTEVIINAKPLVDKDLIKLFGKQYKLSNDIHFINGLKLTSNIKQFGGWSGLMISKDQNKISAISDTGLWLEASLVWKDSVLKSLTSAWIGPLILENGTSLRRAGYGDTESISYSSKTIYIGHESFSSGILKANQKDKLSEAKFKLLHTSSDITSLPKGRGIEALATIHNPLSSDTQILLIAERDPNGNKLHTPAWLLDETGNVLKNKFYLNLSDDYDVSDADYDVHCGLLILERKISWLGRFFVRLIKAKLIEQDNEMHIVNQKVLFEGDSSGIAIDNMEGISVVKNKSGVCSLFMISDSNFLPFQKNVLLHFELY